MNKILLVILLSAISVFAQEGFTLIVKNSAEVEMYNTILNFIASLFQSPIYLNLLKLIVMFGGFMIFLTVITSSYEDPKAGLKKFSIYMLTITGLLSIMTSHNTNLIVKTENLSSVYYSSGSGATGVVSTFPDSATGVVIGNVPYVLAYSLKFYHSFGTEMNTLYGMGLSSVNGYDITNYSKDLRDSMKVLQTSLSVLDPVGASKIEALMKDCIVAPAVLDAGNGEAIMEVMSKTNDIFKTMKGMFVDNSLFLYEMQQNGQQYVTINPDLKVQDKRLKDFLVTYKGEIFQCGQLFTDIAQNVIPRATLMVSPTVKGVGPGAIELLTGQMNVPKSNFEEINIQAGLLSTFGNIKSSLSEEGVPYALGKSRSEFVQTSLASGYFLAEMTPIIQSSLKIIIIAMIPLIFAFSLFPGGIGTLKGFLFTFLWLETWNVTATILNYLMTLKAEASVAGTVSQTRALDMFSDLSGYAAAAGYLYASIGVLSFFVLKGSASGLSGLASGVAARVATNLSSDNMSKDTQKVTKQREDSVRRGEIISMASQDQESARNSAYNEVGGFMGAREIGSEGLINSSNLGLQTPARSALEKINAKGSVAGAAIAESMNVKRDFITNTAQTEHLGAGLDSVSKAKGITNAIGDKSTQTNLNEFGDKKLQSVADKSVVEDTQKKLTRFGEIEKTGNTSKSYGDLSAKVDFNTRENPTNFASDLNGDKKVSGAELKEAGKVADNQSKIGYLQTKETQNQLEMSGQDYLDSSNSRVSSGAGRGNNTTLGKMGAAVTGGAAAKGVTDTFNQVKDSKNVQNLESNNIGAESVANVESKDTMKKVVGAASETDTLTNVLPGVLGQYDEVRGQAVEKLMSQGHSEFEANGMADKALMAKLAKGDVVVDKLTERALESDLRAVNAKEQNAMNGIIKEAVGKDLGAYKNYEHNLNRYNQAMANGDMNQAFALKAQLDKADSGKMGEIKERINTALNSDKAKNVAASFAQEKNAVINDYKKGGFIDVQNGQVKYLDTAKMLQSGNLNDEQRMYMTNKIKAGLDGLRTDMVGLNGMENKFVQDINGNNVTDISKAEISYIKTGNFEHGIMYEAGKSDLVNNSIGKDGLAIASTGADYIGKVASVTAAKGVSGKLSAAGR